MKKRDLVIIAVALIAALAIYFFAHGDSDKVSVYSDGKLWGEFSLSENAVIDINGTNTLKIENGKAYMISATCPDKLCIKQGEIDSDGGAIICLPNRVSAEVKGEVNAVSR